MLAAIALAGCGNAPAVDLRFLAREEACLASRIYAAALEAADTSGFELYALARARSYAATDSALNAATPEDSARFVHRALLHDRAGNARDHRVRADFAAEYALRLADEAALHASDCRRDAVAKARKGRR